MTAEEHLQCAVVYYLQLRTNSKNTLFFHPANGGKRNVIEAAKFKRMGLVPGASDLIIIHNGIPLALELKTEKGRLSDNQLAFQDHWRCVGGEATTAYGYDHAIAAFKAWGVV